MDEQDGGRWSTITLGLDASQLHEEALAWIAARARDGLEHVRVVAVDAPVTEADVIPDDDDADAVRAAVEAALPGVEVTLERHAGPAAEALVSGSGDGDLLVVGAYRGRRGSTAGRTPARVAERALVPTVVVPDVAHPIQGDVVLAVDEPLDERAVRIAVTEAVRRRRRLTLLRAWEMPVVTRTGLTDFAEDPMRWRRQNAALLERATAEVIRRHPGVRLHPMLVEGHPGRAITDHTRLASLVVLGQGHVHLLSGSVLHDVLRDTVSPVCVVPPTAHAAAEREEAVEESA